MLHTYEELLENLGEPELANISVTFWLMEHDRLDPTKSHEQAAFDRLLAFQNGWDRCKSFYGIGKYE